MATRNRRLSVPLSPKVDAAVKLIAERSNYSEGMVVDLILQLALYPDAAAETFAARRFGGLDGFRRMLPPAAVDRKVIHRAGSR